METKAILTPKARVWLEDDNIIRIVILPEAHLTLADGKAIITAVFTFKNTSRLVLADIRQVKTVDRNARQQSSYPEFREHWIAVALLAGSPVSRVIGNFFIGLNRPPIPIELFTSENKALTWLKEFAL